MEVYLPLQQRIADEPVGFYLAIAAEVETNLPLQTQRIAEVGFYLAVAAEVGVHLPLQTQLMAEVEVLLQVAAVGVYLPLQMQRMAEVVVAVGGTCHVHAAQHMRQLE